MAVNKATLPFPAVGSFGRCLRCGYDLTGLPHPVCPECGSDQGASGVLLIAGVPRRLESNPYRQAAWVVLFVAAGLFSQVWPLLFFSGLWIFAVLLLLVLIGGAAALVATGRGRKRAVERIAFTPSGIGRSEWGVADGPSELMPWPEQVYVRVTPVGAVWQTLTVEDHGPTDRRRYFECGFRCERDRLEWVRRAVLSLARGGDIPPEHAAEAG